MLAVDEDMVKDNLTQTRLGLKGLLCLARTAIGPGNARRTTPINLLLRLWLALTPQMDWSEVDAPQVPHGEAELTDTFDILW